MPFDLDPKYTTTEPSLEGLIAWLETQDGETEYNWTSCETCVIGQYMADKRLSNEDAGRAYNRFHDLVSLAEHRYGDFGLNSVSMLSPHTYAAALTRAKALLAERGR